MMLPTNPLRSLPASARNDAARRTVLERSPQIAIRPNMLSLQPTLDTESVVRVLSGEREEESVTVRSIAPLASIRVTPRAGFSGADLSGDDLVDLVLHEKVPAVP